MRRAVEIEGEERVRAAYAKGRGVLFFTGHFGFWELHAIVHALLFEPIGVLARPLDNPGLHDLLESLRQRTGNTVIYREGAVRKVLRTLADGPRRGAAHRSAHAQPRCDLGALLPAAGGDDLHAGGAGAAHRRAGGAGVHRAAAERPLPADLRTAGRAAGARHPRRRCATSRSAAPTCSRCTCAASRSCGCGCIADGATRRRRRRAACSRSCATTERPMPDAPARVVVAAPNWLGDAVMALPALRRGAGAMRRARTSPWRRGRASPPCMRWCRTWTRSWRWRRARRCCARPCGARTRPASRPSGSIWRCCCRTRSLSAWIASKAGIPERWGYAAGGRGRLLTRPVRRPRRRCCTRRTTTWRSPPRSVCRPAPRVAPIAVPDAARDARAALLGRRRRPPGSW